MNIDIIFLTKTSNEVIYNMTNDAINSLINSENEHTFNIIVIESQKNCN